MGMGILIVTSKICKFWVFLILLKINGSRSVKTRQLINIFIKEYLYGFVLFTEVSTPLHYNDLYAS